MIHISLSKIFIEIVTDKSVKNYWKNDLETNLETPFAFGFWFSLEETEFIF